MSSKRATPKQKLLVSDRAHHRCEYCMIPAAYSPQPLAADHVTPFSKGGKTDLSNLALACGCNLFKGDRTHARDPQTNHLVPLFNPRRHKWKTHFKWSQDFQKIIGRTPTGRATIVTLRMNREELTNLREVLHATGKHPPTD